MLLGVLELNVLRSGYVNDKKDMREREREIEKESKKEIRISRVMRCRA